MRGQPAVPISSEGLEGEQDYVISESIPTRTEDQEKHAVSNNDNNYVHDVIFLISWYMASCSPTSSLNARQVNTSIKANQSS